MSQTSIEKTLKANPRILRPSRSGRDLRWKPHDLAKDSKSSWKRLSRGLQTQFDLTTRLAHLLLSLGELGDHWLGGVSVLLRVKPVTRS